ncbi:LPXTG cell wall anchor domain-containing protein [Dorea sp. OM02-2LB]|nr:LPXTG cell wall anchor domain-containing protein [Dorea sp. OM02-2LB]
MQNGRRRMTLRTRQKIRLRTREKIMARIMVKMVKRRNRLKIPIKKAQTVAAKTAAKTGDTSNVWMAAIVMLLAAGATGVVVVYRKKQR